MNYTYEINGAAVNPRGDWGFEYRRNTGQIFWRVFVTGKFIFQGDDYDTIVAMSDCDVLDFEIFCQDESIWTGKFRYPYGFSRIDTDKCIIEGTPEVVDEYTCIMDKYETEYLLSPAGGLAGVTIYSCAGGFLSNLPIGYPILSWLTALINGATKLNCGFSNIYSSFLWRDNFPNGDNYAAAYGGNNYVTGAANRLEYIYLWTNTSLRSQFSGGALTCDGWHYYTFKMWEEYLRNAFNAYWYVDENGDFRIEHISFFLPGFAHSSFGASAIDLTAMLAPQHRNSFAYRRNKYTHSADLLFDQECWTWQHYEGTEGTIAHGSDFVGAPIFYGASADEKYDCVPGDFKEKKWDTPKWWSDIYWAQQLQAAGTASTINCGGLCFADVDTAPVPDRIRCEPGAISGGNVINGHCSTANLHDYYHTWNRIFLTGNMNNTPAVAFDSAIKKKLQEKITFPVCCMDFDPLAGITTEMGVGLIHSASIDKKSVTIELLYD